MTTSRKCWCYSTDLLDFGPEYGECRSCGTLVSFRGLSSEQLLVQNDETDFYGKKYWMEHQSQDLGFPDIYSRARTDLTERNLHWLKTLLKYRVPPARVLELGCAHGGFVALMCQAGYEASGVEMSPWVVEFGKKTFGTPIFTGPVESLELPPCSFDAIVLMDVLEHLPDPLSTMSHCLKLLKSDGLLLIQAPQFKEDMDYTKLMATDAAFLKQLKSDEHLYLFSKRSVTELFRRLHAEYIQFEPAIFSHYDMFFVVSKEPLLSISKNTIENVLSTSPNSRIIQALIDLDDQCQTLKSKCLDNETDLAARLAVIHKLGAQLQEFEAKLLESETDRIVLLDKIAELDDKIHTYQEEICRREKYLAEVKMSTCWRFTAPLRYLKTLFMKMKSISRALLL